MDGHSKTTIRFIDDLIANYAKYDKDDSEYYLYLDTIPEHSLHKLTALFMQDSLDGACESTGPDNDEYERKMLPALMSYMNDFTNKDNAIEFVTQWREGLINHYWNRMRNLLNDRLEIYNEDHSCAA